ncbi:MAG: glycosyltransferase family 9 protein [Candidatus Omnitrophica bacterium]|nr:glycosyltransferase family 9 protein [Candidatus Omnitrophota bacterium]
MRKRILIIKLASAGDVLRSTTLLSELRKNYPGAHVTWLVEMPGSELLEGNSNIDRILIFSPEIAGSLKAEQFDIVISLDKANEAASLAAAIRAKEKYGFGLDKNGKLCPLSKEAEYSYLLGLDDELKFFKNKKTYQELIFETVGLDYKGNPYELVLDKKHIDFAGSFFKKNNLNGGDVVIGINTGTGSVFANKNLKKERIVELIRLLDKEVDAKIVLLGGPLEKEINEYIEKALNHRVINSGCENTLKDFAALINNCSLIITADTLALHIAIALERPVVALFGPTCHQEIDLYNRGHKMVTEAGCAPCYKNSCDKKPSCMDMIQLDSIVEKAKDLAAAYARS